MARAAAGARGRRRAQPLLLAAVGASAAGAAPGPLVRRKPRPGPATPLFHGCLDEASRALPYCDPALEPEARVDDILARLSMDEKISLLSPSHKPYCVCDSPAVGRIGLPGYIRLTEVNTDVQTKRCMRGRCPTVFVGPQGMAASFNRTSWWLKGDVVSTEMRAVNNRGWRGVGLTGFGPNINLVKDPRYGRNSELPGEDPFLSGSYAVEYLRGLQQVSNGTRHHLKVLAYVKHYTAYNVETGRWTFKGNVTQFDFWDSYLLQYEMAFAEGRASGAMCSYFAQNGVSSCGNDWLLNRVIRGFWGRPDAVVMSDCAAVANMARSGYARDELDASAKALSGGMDVYGGWNDNLWAPPPQGRGLLRRAIEANLTTAEALDRALRRTMLQKMRVGLFDPLEDQAWTRLPPDVIGSARHAQVSYEAALRGMVLLKNSGALPLRAGARLAVVGPMATEGRSLFSDYADPHPPFDTLLAALRRANRGGVTAGAAGVPIAGDDAGGIPAALELVRGAEVTVLALGIGHKEEREGLDRKDTRLPGLQEAFAHQVLAAAGGPVVLVLCNGGILSFDSLVQPAAAIVEAFNPAAQGPAALAALLLGAENRWGKLPVTVYGEDYAASVSLFDMSFAAGPAGPGRSYRYYTGQPLFWFGEGLSYTTFWHACGGVASAGLRASGSVTLRCTMENAGAREGDEVLMVFHSVSEAIRAAAGHAVPRRKLVAFQRVRLAPGESAELALAVPVKRLAVTNGDGDYALYEGRHLLTASRGNGEDVVAPVDIAAGHLWRNSHPEPPAESAESASGSGPVVYV